MNYSAEIYNDNYLNFWQTLLDDKIKWLYNSYNDFINDWEDDFFQVINNHQEIFNADQLPTMFRNLIVPLIIPFIMLLIALITILIIPRYCFVQFCRRKRNINEFKYAWFFGIKIFFTINIILLLIALTTASIKSSSILDLAIRNSVDEAHGIVDELHNEKAKFELQLHDVNNSITGTLLSVQNMISNLPENMYHGIKTSIEQELNVATISYNNIMNKTDFILNQSGMKIIQDSVQNILQIELNIVEEKLMTKFNENMKILSVNIRKNVHKFNENITEHILNDLLKVNNYAKHFRGKYTFPNWTKMYTNLQETYITLMPQIIKNFGFINLYPVKLENNLKNNEEQIYNDTQKFMNESDIIIKKLFNISGNIYHNSLKCAVKKLLSVSNSTLFYINRNSTIFYNIYFSSILFIIPNLHSYLCAFSIFLICIIIIHQMNCSRRNFIMKSSYNNCTTILIKLIILFSLALLWTGIVLSAIYYMGALSLSVICRPIMTDHLYMKYIDNIEVWENKTWLDHIVYPWNHNYKLKEILENCSKNVTVYQAFNVEKFWHISNLFQNNELSINKQELIQLMKSAIDSVEMPNGEICSTAKDKFNIIENEIAIMSPHIMYDVELLQNNSLKIHLQNMIQNYGDILELHQNLDILNYIQNQNLVTILSNFMEFKYLLKLQQNDLTKIGNMEQQITDKIKSNVHILISNKVQNITEAITNLLINLEENLSKKIQNEIGNCYTFPLAIEKVKETACVQLPLLFNMSWMLLSFTSILLIISIFCCCELCNAIIRIQNEKAIWRERLESEKQHARRKRLLTGTLLFDRSGKFMGESRTLLTPVANLPSEQFLIHEGMNTN